MMPRPRLQPLLLPLLVVSLALALVVGCTSTAPAPSAPVASTPATAAQPKEKPAAPAKAEPAAMKKVTFVDGIVTPTRWPVWIAVEEGLFKKYGLDLELVRVESGPVATQTLVGRRADFSMSSPTDSLTAASAGAPIKIVLTLQTKADINFMAKPGIDSPAKLKGAKVGISSFGAISHMTAWLIVQSLGLDPEKDVAYVPIGNDVARAAALQAGSIDAAALNPTATGQVRRALGLKPMVDGSQSDFSFPGASLFLLASTLQNDRQMVKGVAAGIIDGIDWVNNPANKKKVLGIMEKYMKLKPDDPSLEEAYETYVIGKLFQMPPRVPRDGVKKMQDFSVKFNDELKKVNLDELLDARLVDEAMAERR